MGGTSSTELARYHLYATGLHLLAFAVSATMVLQYPNSVVVGGFPVSIWIALFFGVTVMGELYASNEREMRRRLNAQGTPWRWVEYALSASFMLIAIAQLCRVTNAYTLTMGVVLPNVLCMATGHLLERTGNYLWLLAGSVLGAVPWVFIIISFIRYGDQAPDFVIGILISLVLAFLVFPLIAFLHVTDRISYAQAELGYIYASFFAKTLLGAQVLGGALQADGDINY